MKYSKLHSLFIILVMSLFVTSIIDPSSTGIINNNNNNVDNTIQENSIKHKSSENIVGVWDLINTTYRKYGVTFYDIKFWNVTHGWVVGENSTEIDVTNPYYNSIILHTTDGGLTWQLQYFNASNNFRCIEIVDSNTVWVGANRGAFYTRDSGLNWNYKYIGGDTTGIDFLNSTHGWACDVGLSKTTNGGETWQDVDTLDLFDQVPSDNPRSVSFVSTEKIWVTTFFGIYASFDGGITWQKQHNNGGWSICSVNENNLWAVGNFMVAHTTNGGTTWNSLPLPKAVEPVTVGPYFTDIDFIDSNNGWIAGTEPQISYTPNGGIDWVEQSFSVDRTISMYAVDILDESHGWISGSSGYILRTTKANTHNINLTDSTQENWINNLSFQNIVIFGSIISIIAILVILIRKNSYKK